MKNNQKNILFAICLFFIAIIASVVLFNRSYAQPATQHVEIDEGAELMYNITIEYDGRDRNGRMSSENARADVKSDIISVEDQLPNGMTFQGFKTTTNGKITATVRNGVLTCSGSVIDDTNEESFEYGEWNSNNTEYTYHGLHYNANTKKVTFRVSELEAGCTITVGVKIKAPDTIDDPNTLTIETRRDFYNTAYSHERSLNQSSNMVHTYMGDETPFKYRVIYSYEGTPPESNPSPPADQEYYADSEVTVASIPVIEGYTFVGWDSSDVTINNNKFTMPNKDVTLTGSFIKKVKHKVTYKIVGDIPPNYNVPQEVEYYQDELVTVDTLKDGDIVGQYTFNGWEINNIIIENGKFTMPTRDVVIEGSFSPIEYKVTYQFKNTCLPPDYEDLLPEEESYQAGTEVRIAESPNEPDGYVFLGWDKTGETFTMPESDVVILGEWREQTGVFEPTIAKVIINGKTYYRVGDKVEAKITITNPSSIEIKEVIVQDDGVFDNITGYEIVSDHIAKIPSIPSGGSVDLYTKYTVKSTDIESLEQTAKIKSATADNGYELKNKKYEAKITVTIQSRLKICNEITGATVNDTFEYLITNITEGFETSFVIAENACKTIYLSPAKYRVKQIIPQEYGLSRVEGAMYSNNSEVQIYEGQAQEIKFTNRFARKGFFHSIASKINTIVQGNS